MLWSGLGQGGANAGTLERRIRWFGCIDNVQDLMADLVQAQAIARI